jgi:ABC-type glycerol-3-phosphate transport system substrate-binding protein
MLNQNKQKIAGKLFILCLAVALTAQSCNLGGPSKAGGKEIDLTWWQPFDDQSVVQPLIDAFQKANPKTHIHYVQKNVDTYEEELIDALAAGQGPDIFAIHNDWLPKHKDKLAPAPTSIFSLRDYQQNFVEVAISDFVSDDKVYAVPLGLDVLTLYYNKDILSSAGIARSPATWEELVNMVPKITRQDNQGNFLRSTVALGTSDNVNRAPDILELLMLQNGTQFYSPDFNNSAMGQNLTDDKGNPFSPAARALEFYTQFANPAKVTYTWNSQSNNSIEAFAAGKVAMIFSYSYLRPTLAAKAPFLNYGIAPVPQIDSVRNKINFANYWGQGVSKQSQNTQAAWTFLKFITQSNVLTKYYEVQKQASPRKDIIEKQISDPDIGIFAENALTAKSVYKPDSNAIESVFLQMIDNVILHNVVPADAVNAAVQKINLLLRNQ